MFMEIIDITHRIEFKILTFDTTIEPITRAYIYLRKHVTHIAMSCTKINHVRILLSVSRTLWKFFTKRCDRTAFPNAPGASYGICRNAVVRSALRGPACVFVTASFSDTHRVLFSAISVPLWLRAHTHTHTHTRIYGGKTLYRFAAEKQMSNLGSATTYKLILARFLPGRDTIAPLHEHTRYAAYACVYNTRTGAIIIFLYVIILVIIRVSTTETIYGRRRVY
jgi:hypothetical protein